MSDFVTYVGLATLALFGLKVLSNVYIYFLRPGKNLKKYGKWAVVTGATDGIGYAYACELAKKGINIVLISRTQSKLDTSSEAISSKYNVETKTIAIDFSSFKDAEVEKVKSVLASLDVGILINNVGQSYRFPLYLMELSDADCQQLIDLNIQSVCKMTRVVLPGMVERKRGAIVNISSASGAFPCPLLSQYSASKSYVEKFGSGLDLEYRPKGVHVQTQMPLFVTTKLAKIRRASLTVPSPATYVKCGARFIGYESVCSPYWVHALMTYVIGLSTTVRDWQVTSSHLSLRKRGLKKEAKKAAEAKSK